MGEALAFSSAGYSSRLTSSAVGATPISEFRRPHWIWKFTLLTSETVPSRTQLTRIRAAVVAGPVTTQVDRLDVSLELCELFGMTIDHEAPPFRLTSILTVSSVPRLCVQPMVLVDPIAQMTLVFGTATMTVGVASVTSPSLRSLSDVSLDQLTRTRPCVVTTDGIGPV